MEQVKITQNGARYTQDSNGNWTISATSQQAIGAESGSKALLESASVAPILLTSEAEPEWVPLLAVDGIVVKVMGKNLVSQATLDSIRDSGNPHWDVKGNGVLRIKDKEVVIGRNIPTIEFPIDALPEIAKKRDVGNAYAGVKGVKYTHTTDLEGGLPKGLIAQINYTLDGNSQRPEDTYSYYRVSLRGDYSVAKLKTDTAQADGSLDKEKLKRFVSGVSERLKLIRGDYNTIKRMFYLGVEPVGSLLYTDTLRANAEGDIQAGQAASIVLADSPVITELKDTPAEILANRVTQQAAQTQQQIANTQQAIANQAFQLASAQAGDRNAQAGLAGALAAAQNDVAFLREVLAKNNIK